MTRVKALTMWTGGQQAIEEDGQMCLEDFMRQGKE